MQPQPLTRNRFFRFDAEIFFCVKQYKMHVFVPIASTLQASENFRTILPKIWKIFTNVLNSVRNCDAVSVKLNIPKVSITLPTKMLFFCTCWTKNPVVPGIQSNLYGELDMNNITECSQAFLNLMKHRVSTT